MARSRSCRRLLQLLQLAAKAAQPFLALGQFDLVLGDLAVGRQPLASPARRSADQARPLPTPSRPARHRSALASAAPRPSRAAAASCCRRASSSSVCSDARCSSSWLRRTSAAAMAARFSAKCIDGLLMFGCASVDKALLDGDLLVQLGDFVCGSGNGGRQFARAVPAAPATGFVARSARSIRFAARRPACRRLQQFAGKGNVAQSAADRLGQGDCVVKLLHEPRSPQQPLGQRRERGSAILRNGRPGLSRPVGLPDRDLGI